MIAEAVVIIRYVDGAVSLTSWGWFIVLLLIFSGRS